MSTSTTATTSTTESTSTTTTTVSTSTSKDHFLLSSFRETETTVADFCMSSKTLRRI
jgi:hypothetical protein